MPLLLKDECGKASSAFEAATCWIEGTFVKKDGSAIALAHMISLTLTLYDKKTGDIINSRNIHSVLNENGGTVSALGVLSLELAPADNVIVTAGQTPGSKERHVARLIWTWNSGSGPKTGKEELEFEVEVLAEVP